MLAARINGRTVAGVDKTIMSSVGNTCSICCFRHQASSWNTQPWNTWRRWNTVAHATPHINFRWANSTTEIACEGLWAKGLELTELTVFFRGARFPRINCSHEFFCAQRNIKLVSPVFCGLPGPGFFFSIFPTVTDHAPHNQEAIRQEFNVRRKRALA